MRGPTAHAARIARERLRLQTAAGGDPAPDISVQLAELTRAIHAADDADPIAALARRLDVDRRSEDFLAFVIACCTDPVCAAALLRLQGSSAQHGPTIASYVSVSGAGDDARELALELATTHPLVETSILETRSDPGVTPVLRLWSVSPRVARQLTGDTAVAEPLQTVTVPELALFDEEQRHILDALGRALASDRPLTILMEGPTGSGRATAVAAAAEGLARPVAMLALDRIDRTPEALEHGLRALRRETALAGAIAVIRGLEELDGADETARRRRLEHFIGTARQPMVVISSLAGQSIRVPGEIVRADWTAPGTAARRNMWSVLLELHDPEHGLSDLDLDELGHRYSLGPGAMRDAIATAKLAAGRKQLTMAGVVSALRQRTTERLTGLTTHVRVRQEWSDLVVAQDTRDQIQALISRVRHSHQVLERWGLEQRVGRATGVAALFSGAPGTGKTMVAGLVAKELGLDLHQIELSQVLSKWIGETEKQLAQIFDAAGTGHCLLLFDEADALFTKRTEVKSSNDRHSNLEVNFLLQRMEAFRGIVILTTNLDSSMDPAFKRRLASHIVFWPPDDDERDRLWKSYLSSGLPVAQDLDIDKLVRNYPDLSGAHIRNAVLNAAFAAATRGGIVTQAALESAARNEYATMGRVLARDGRIR
ncbi:MAG: ATP-binding protein [Deltaproteobacteria bacterium]|nr:ATP-binding protein [Deltaproteobacteria bacterium]MDQ3298150.1 ATP-binding protein [Myxococcota bacterium]